MPLLDTIDSQTAKLSVGDFPTDLCPILFVSVRLPNDEIVDVVQPQFVTDPIQRQLFQGAEV